MKRAGYAVARNAGVATVFLALVAGTLAFAGSSISWLPLVALLALAPVAVLVRAVLAPSGKRSLFAPLPIFVFAFVIVLGLRAVPLALGVEGRYFTVDGSSGATQTVLGAHLANDDGEAELSAATRAEVAPAGAARVSVRGSLLHGYLGAALIELNIRTNPSPVIEFIAIEFPVRVANTVLGGGRASAALAIHGRGHLAPPTSLELLLRFRDAEGRYLADIPASRNAAHHSVSASSTSGRWAILRSEGVAPIAAHTVTPLLIIRDVLPATRQVYLVDAPLAIAGGTPAQTYLRHVSPWRDAFTRALAIAVAMLISVYVGYALPWGARVARRLPSLRFADVRERNTRRLLSSLIVVGACAWLVEMWTYGGYGGYLRALSTIGSDGLGRWYIHTLATLPTGAAMLLLARRLGSKQRAFSRLELGVVGVGIAVAGSYWLKTTIAIPALTLLLFLSFYGRRTHAAMWVGAGLFALITPFVYLVRGSGSVAIGELFTGSYWTDFGSTLVSRFFHFESLMIVVPYGSRDPFWTPLTEFVQTAVPRVLWEGKPVSAATRFTEEYLMSGLHNPSDVGVLSLPGEAWLVGGVIGVIVVGMLIGTLLRAAQTVVDERPGENGSLLLAAGLVTGLVFLNDGWGLASAAIQMLILSLGWLLLLRKQSTS